MAATRILPRGVGIGNGRGLNGLANDEQPSGASPELIDAINELLTALGAEPITPGMPEAEIVQIISGLAHGLDGAGDDQSAGIGAAGMSNRSPRQRVAEMSKRESRVAIAKRISARQGKRWEDVLKFVP